MKLNTEKYEKLLIYLKELGSLAVAFSGGVDSTLLLYAAKEALGDDVVAVSAVSEAFPESEMQEAKDYCAQLGVKQIVCRTSDLLEIDGFSKNPPERCYLCKKEIFTRLQKAAKEQGMAYVAEGSNLDDNRDYRPGHRAIRELGVKSPLRDCGLSKAEIRELSAWKGLPTWNKPSFACLASRFVYGEEITAAKLKMVERAEVLLRELGFAQVRVRIHGTIARIETLPEDIDRFLDVRVRTKVEKELKGYGFSYVSLDLTGYRSGSMNEMLSEEEKRYGLTGQS